MKQNQQHLQFFAALAVWLACVVLAGCGTAPPATQIVQVPVYAPCVKDLPVAPVYEFDKLSLNAPDGEKVLALARDWPRGRRYEGELMVAITGCR